MTYLYKQSEVALRRMRQKIWGYDDTPKEAQATRVLHYLKARALRDREKEIAARPVGRYSGLTQRDMPRWLCETDFY